MGSSLLALNHLNRINLTKMSETEVKTDAPTAEEIKGTKRTAEDELDVAKKQKTENGSNGAGNGAAAEENGADVEEEEDVDEEDEEALGRKKKERVKKTLTKKPKEKRVKKRKTAREKRKRKETTKFSCLLSPNLVISYYIYQIRHLIIISALQKKGQKEIDCVSSKSTPIQTREMPDQFPTIHKTTEHPLTKQKKKKTLFPPKKKKKKKKKKK